MRSGLVRHHLLDRRRRGAGHPALDGDGAFLAIRLATHRKLRDDFRGFPIAPREAWRRAYNQLAALINAPENGTQFKLAAGEMMIMDNRRILHGRLAFEDTGARHLQGAYADCDGVLSALAVLNAREATRRVDHIADLFASNALSGGYGERLEHSRSSAPLAAADLALEQGSGRPAWSWPGLLHDIGWGMAAGEAADYERIEPSFVDQFLGAVGRRARAPARCGQTLPRRP